MRIPDDIQILLDDLVEKYKVYVENNPKKLKKHSDAKYALDSYVLGIPETDYVGHMRSGAWSLDLTPNRLQSQVSHWLDQDDTKEILQIYEEISVSIGTHFMHPLLTYYPEGGYIGWHHNADAPGQNIFFNWSRDGGGVYKTWNNITKEFEYYPDNKGWTIKSHYYRGWNEVDKTGYSWHAMTTDSPRITVAFILPEYDTGLGEMIKDMFEITGSPSINGVYCEGAN